jgi:hypothetical protein
MQVSQLIAQQQPLTPAAGGAASRYRPESTAGEGANKRVMTVPGLCGAWRGVGVGGVQRGLRKQELLQKNLQK